jgi:heptosyltransferase-3
MFVKGKGVLSKDIRSVLLVQLGDIGDVVLSLPCIRALYENFPGVRIAVAVRSKAAGLLTHCPWVSEVISIAKTKQNPFARIIQAKSFIAGIRRGHFDLAFDLRTDDRGAILVFLSGAGQRISYFADDGKLWRNSLFTDLLANEYDPATYVADYYFALLKSCGLHVSQPLPELPITNDFLADAATLLAREQIPGDKPIIAIQPFSLWSYKEWGTRRTVELLRRLVIGGERIAIIIGSAPESTRAEEIRRQCGAGVYNLAGKTSIEMLPAVLRKCFLFVGVDSAGLHLAAAVGVPTVGIFGPSSSVSWAPKGKRHRIVTNTSYDCVPCRDKGCQDSEISRCLEELSVDAVARVVEEVGNGIIR